MCVRQFPAGVLVLFLAAEFQTGDACGLHWESFIDTGTRRREDNLSDQ